MTSRWAVTLALGTTLTLGCNGVSATPILEDASTDATAMDATAADASDAGTASDAPPDACVTGQVVAATGDTCAGFGTGESCDPACGLPPYGYVCTGGGPPGFAGCVRVSESALLGGTYCCPELKCVRVTSQDVACADAGAPLLYQCAPEDDGGLLAAPAAGCTEITGLPSYRYFCCAQ